MDTSTLIAFIALIVSVITSFATVYLTVITIREANRLARASRRTLALNCLSDEKLALMKVRIECESLRLLVESSSDKLNVKSFLLSETERIVAESKMMLADVDKKKSTIESRLGQLSAAEIEEIIAESYEGKIMAEAQLSRTTRSREDTIKLYLEDLKD